MSDPLAPRELVRTEATIIREYAKRAAEGGLALLAQQLHAQWQRLHTLADILDKHPATRQKRRKGWD